MTSEIAFDIETTGIDNFQTLAGLERIHCIGVSSLDGKHTELYGPDRIAEGLAFLAEQDVIYGHNVVGFDIPAIQKLYPDWRPKGLVRDTMIMGRMAHPDRSADDWAVPQAVAIPVKLRGRHSLESWGERLKCKKQDFGKETDWAEYSEAMGLYCMQDVEVTRRLYLYLTVENGRLDAEAVQIEHDFAAALYAMSARGFVFDTPAAARLYAELVDRRDVLERRLQSIFPPETIKMKTPQYYKDADGNRYRVKSLAPARLRPELYPGPLKEKIIPFNPGSRVQIARAFQDKYGWKPAQYTAKGDPKIDESILTAMQYPEARPLSEYLMVTKRLGMLAEGKEAYLKLEINGRIHGRVVHWGTVTGRSSHSRPNTGQVPSTRSPYGKEFRSLFRVEPGHKLVGCDAAQLELRCLAHYMRDPDYVDVILNGDIHTRNQKAAGLKTRDQAKVFAYAVCYGAGPRTLGKIVGTTPKQGGILRKRFLNNLPALGNLLERVAQSAQSRKYLRGLLRHRLPVRSAHKGLNTLLQGAGATIMKVAIVEMHKECRKRGWQNRAYMVAFVHDEVQWSCEEAIAEELGQMLADCFRKTTDILQLSCPMDADFHIGNTWAETH